MNQVSFFVINNRRFDDTFFAYGEERGIIKTGDALKCSECESFVTSLEWLPPLEITVSKRIIGDLIFGTFNHFIVSEKFKNLYLEARMSGINLFKPVSLYYRNQLIDRKYYYPDISLSNVLVDLKKSAIEFEGNEKCNTCQKAGRIIKHVKGLYFENEETISEDIFSTKVFPGVVIVSEQFRALISDLSNASFVHTYNYVPNWILK